MQKLYQAYISTGEQSFESNITEIEVAKVLKDGTIKTKRPVFYDVLEFSDIFNGSGVLKTDLEYSAGKSFTYFSTSYEKCIDYIVRKRESSVGKIPEIIRERNEFYEGKTSNFYELRVDNDRIGCYPMWVENYYGIGTQRVAFRFSVLSGNKLKVSESD